MCRRVEGRGWEVEALASFIPCSSGVPHRADIAHKALIVTAGFPKYEALRGFRCVPQCVVGQGNVSPTGVCGRREGKSVDMSMTTMCCVSDKCVGGSKGGWEVEALASFIPCSSGVPHRADIAHKALIVTAGFPKYEALRGFRCVPQWVVCQINASAGRRTHGPCVPTFCGRFCCERGVCG
jgi:hypothetical protein